jgi:hypothetical protein
MMRIDLKLPRACVVDTGPIMILSGAARLRPSIKADSTCSISAFTIASMASPIVRLANPFAESCRVAPCIGLTLLLPKVVVTCTDYYDRDVVNTRSQGLGKTCYLLLWMSANV